MIYHCFIAQICVSTVKQGAVFSRQMTDEKTALQDSVIINFNSYAF